MKIELNYGSFEDSMVRMSVGGNALMIFLKKKRKNGV